MIKSDEISDQMLTIRLVSAFLLRDAMEQRLRKSLQRSLFQYLVL